MLYLRVLLLVLFAGVTGFAVSQEAGGESPAPAAEGSESPQPVDSPLPIDVAEPTDVEILCQPRGFIEAPECQSTKRRQKYVCSDGKTRYGECLR